MSEQLHSFAIHEVQCREMFDKWEAQKPLKDRRRCPDDPMKYMMTGGSGGGIGVGDGYRANMSRSDLDELNAASQRAWSDGVLVKCQHCVRTFLPEKLSIHQRSCTAQNPAKGVGFVGQSLPSSKGENTTSNGYTRYDDVDIQSVNINSGNLMQCQNCQRKFNAQSYVKHAKVCVKVFSHKRKVFDSAKHRAMGTELESFRRFHSKYDRKVSGIVTSSSSSSSSSSSYQASKGINNTSNITTRKGMGADISMASQLSLSLTQQQQMPKWKVDSMRFRSAMRAARQVSQAEKKSKATGIPLHILLPQSSGSSRGTGAGSSDSFDYNGSGAMQCPTCGRSFSQKAGERHIPQCKNIINKPSRLAAHSGSLSYSMSDSDRGVISSSSSFSSGQHDMYSRPVSRGRTSSVKSSVDRTSLGQTMPTNTPQNRVSFTDDAVRQGASTSNRSTLHGGDLNSKFGATLSSSQSIEKNRSRGNGSSVRASTVTPTSSSSSSFSSNKPTDYKLLSSNRTSADNPLAIKRSYYS